ncbi:MAG: DNA alkylation repair protein [Candidatus Doudnabacteria bacterium]|nr:DNA alkylation repair protein [Candidatus Doudnabacteria bacterium]
MNNLNLLRAEIKKLASPAKAKILQRFFKTAPGQYGAGDIFLGLMVPQQRVLENKYWDKLSLSDLDKLIKSKIHEERLIALLILVKKYSEAQRRHSDPDSLGEGSHLKITQEDIYKFYLGHTKYINNWDLVDLSAPNIVGRFLLDKDRKILYQLAKSKSLWERRVAILATFAFLKNGETKDAVAIAKSLLADKHDLIHKATGWMLREMGKRCGEKYLTDFLDANVNKMPRTALRYSIERLPEKKRKYYLAI